MTYLNEIKIIQSNFNDVKNKNIGILEKMKTLGFLSSTLPIENSLKTLLFHIHLPLVSTDFH